MDASDHASSRYRLGNPAESIRMSAYEPAVNRGSLKTALRRRGLPPALQVITTKDAYFWDGMT